MSGLLIERFTSWEEIFPDPTEQERQFQAYLEKMRKDYHVGSSRVKEIVTVEEGTGFTTITFEEPSGTSYSSVQRLGIGDIKLVYADPERNREELITPEAGNKSHDWTFDGIKLMHQTVKSLIRSKPHLVLMETHLRGKPATMGWEETFIHNKHFPQRVGYMLYPDQSLREAQAFVDPH
jgi:hypothetical protein